MIRPVSIIRFEYCYLGAWAVGIVNVASSWSHTIALPQVQQANAVIGTWYLPLTMGISLLIPLILWYFAARRASVVAKWIIVVFAAVAAFGVASSLLFATFASGLSLALGIVAFALQIAAAWLLFQPDSKAWFGEKIEGDIA